MYARRAHQGRSELGTASGVRLGWVLGFLDAHRRTRGRVNSQLLSAFGWPGFWIFWTCIRVALQGWIDLESASRIRPASMLILYAGRTPSGVNSKLLRAFG